MKKKLIFILALLTTGFLEASKEKEIKVKPNITEQIFNMARDTSAQLVSRLKESQYDINFRDPNRDTALIIAVRNNDINAVRNLLIAGANIKIQNNSKQTALELARKLGNKDIIHELASAEEKLVMPKAKKAEKEDSVDRVLKAAEQDKLKTSNIFINITDKEGRSPLMRAVMHLAYDDNKDSMLKAIDNLLKSKANLDLQDRMGNTALILAINMANNEDVALKLLEKNASANLKDNLGYNAFDHAIFANHPRVVEAILKKDRSVIDRQDKLGRTPLMDAAIRGNYEIVKILFDKLLALQDPSNYSKLEVKDLAGKTAKDLAFDKFNKTKEDKYQKIDDLLNVY